jgi:hypothetical protein
MNPSPDGRGEFAPLDFSDLTPIEFPFSYKGKKYVLCEASADAASKYRNASPSPCSSAPRRYPN